MYCRQCGYKLEDNERYCPQCGYNTQEKEYIRTDTNLQDVVNPWVNLLCFMIPAVGIFLFLVWLNTYPNKSKASLKWTIIGIIVRAIFGFVLYLFLFVRIFALF